jgi:subtilisin family serine protease
VRAQPGILGALDSIADGLRSVIPDAVTRAAPADVTAMAAVAPAMTATPPMMVASPGAVSAGVGSATISSRLAPNPLTGVDSPLAWSAVAASRARHGRTGRMSLSAAGQSATYAAGPAMLPTATGAAAPVYAPGEVLVAWKPGASANARGLAMALVKANVMARMGTKQMLDTDQGVIYRLKVTGSTEAAIKALSKNPAVAFVEPNYKLSSTAAVTSTNDPYYTSGSLWGMSSDDSPAVYGPSGTTNAFGSGAEEAWGQGYTGSRSVVVAVLDEGIQITHPDLAANIWFNPHETAGDGLDNDGNGYADDVNGWDFYYDDNSVYHLGEDAHGTHVAGTIGGVGGNGIGVSGVSPTVQIISTKFLGPQGGYISDAVDAMNYLTDLKTRNMVNLVAVNNSWGGGGYSNALHGAILRAAKADILFVAAAGNSTLNTDTTANWPSNYSTLQASATESAAGYESVISVASITSTGALSSFSNYGASTVDIGAPGSAILSTVPDGYANYNGTSMAAPHVTGAIALFKAFSPTSTAAGLRTAILGNAKATTALAGKTLTGGRLSVEGMFTAVAPPTPVPSTYDPTVASVSAPKSVRAGKNGTVTVTVGNLGNSSAQVRVTLATTGGSSLATTVTVPAGGKASAAFAWKAPTVKGTYLLSATAALVSTTIVDADTTNNSQVVYVKVT